MKIDFLRFLRVRSAAGRVRRLLSLCVPRHPACSRWRRLLFDVADAWLDRRASSKGAALAFYTLFSMAPMLLVVIALAGAVFGRDAAQGAIFSQLRALFGSDGARAIAALIASARDPAKGMLATGMAFLLLMIGATSVFAELKGSLDDIWQAHRGSKSGLVDFVRTRILSLSLLAVLAFLLMVSLVVSAALAAFARYWDSAALIAAPLSALFSFAIASCLFAAIYQILPQVPLSYRDVWIGALGTSALFMLGKYLIGVYLGNSDVISAYGSAGSLIAVLLWVYYSAQIFFFGAEFTHQYALTFGSLAAAPGMPDAEPGAASQPSPDSKSTA